MSPKRIQMTRAIPWRKHHPDAVIVDRRTPWGNPFVIGAPGVPDAATAVRLFRSAIFLTHWAEAHAPVEENMLLAGLMAEMPGPVPRLDAIREHLAGCELACWCPIDQPCHGDVLIELANGAAA
jgi:hypothetical protein